MNNSLKISLSPRKVSSAENKMNSMLSYILMRNLIHEWDKKNPQEAAGGQKHRPRDPERQESKMLGVPMQLKVCMLCVCVCV